MATIKRRISGAAGNIIAIKKRSGGVTSNAIAGWVKVGGVLVKFWANEHSVSVPDLNVNTANGAQSFTRTATVSGGIGGFTYSWTIVSGGGFTLSNTTSATVTINSTGTNVLKEGVIRCSVTDAGNGNLVRSDDASVAIQHGTPV